MLKRELGQVRLPGEVTARPILESKEIQAVVLEGGKMTTTNKEQPCKSKLGDSSPFQDRQVDMAGVNWGRAREEGRAKEGTK